jgi:type IV pilus biogenesis protein CpaD/CtpE
LVCDFPKAMNLLRPLLATLALAALAGCGKRDPHAGHSHGGHAHTAPHGGLLVEIGDHAYNVELVRDDDAGKLTAYILDGHAENFVRLAAPAITVTAYAAGARQTATLAAIANSATGETVGNTSQFEGPAAWLKDAGEFNGEVGALEIKGSKFAPTAFKLPRKK